uniref:Ubiquinol-cytochrome c reductase core protein 1 n=1 Tax=Rousettus aegyptiacus TaxID=9407 RepID=A0A7J8HXS1_ROUAE|nr:ubiquinol-cytochrome c reductase core protein 1 [Rousettus aegyptiacus]
MAGAEERSRWTQDGCMDGNLSEVGHGGEGVGAGSGTPPQLMALAAGWAKKTDRKSTIGDFGASEPGDQEKLELLAHQALLSPTGSELGEGKNARQRRLVGCTPERLPTALAPTSQGEVDPAEALKAWARVLLVNVPSPRDPRASHSPAVAPLCAFSLAILRGQQDLLEVGQVALCPRSPSSPGCITWEPVSKLSMLRLCCGPVMGAVPPRGVCSAREQSLSAEDLFPSPCPAAKKGRGDPSLMRDSPYSVPRSLSGQYRSVSAGVEHRQLVDLAQKHFGSVSGAYTEDTVPSLAPCRFTGSQIGHRDDALPLAHVAVAVEGPGWANPDNVTLQVANAIIGHYDCTYGGGRHLSSPLASVAVANKLCQSFQTFSICYAETGLLGAHFVCDRMTVDDMMFFLQGQWMRLCTSATDSEVLRGRNILRNALVSHLDGTTTVCEDIGRSLLTYGRRIPLTEWESRIAEVDAQAVREVCSKYFYDQCPAVAALGE